MIMFLRVPAFYKEIIPVQLSDSMTNYKSPATLSLKSSKNRWQRLCAFSARLSNIFEAYPLGHTVHSDSVNSSVDRGVFSQIALSYNLAIDLKRKTDVNTCRSKKGK